MMTITGLGAVDPKVEAQARAMCERDKAESMPMDTCISGNVAWLTDPARLASERRRTTIKVVSLGGALAAVVFLPGPWKLLAIPIALYSSKAF